MDSPRDSNVSVCRKEGRRSYKKELSLYVDVGDNQAIKASSVIQAVEKLCGVGQLFACVPKSGNMYVLTLKDKDVADLVSDGINFGNKSYKCEPVKKETMFVSIMNVDPFVPDEEIQNKLKEFGVEILGNVRRICYENTDVENGNRVCKIKIPQGFVSLPYLIKLSDGETSAMYRVIHDNQRKLCHRCHKEDHLFRDCPEFVCYKCSKQEHFKHQCRAIWCDICFKWDCGIEHQDVSETEVETVVRMEQSSDREEDIDIDVNMNACEICGNESENCHCRCEKRKCIACFCAPDDCEISDNCSSHMNRFNTEDGKTSSPKSVETVFGDIISVIDAPEKSSEIPVKTPDVDKLVSAREMDTSPVKPTMGKRAHSSPIAEKLKQISTGKVKKTTTTKK